MTQITSGLRLRELRGPADYPGMTEANQEARVAAGRPSGITVTDLGRYLEHLVNCDPAEDLVVAETDGRIRGYGIAFWRDLVDVLGAPELADDPRFRGFPERFANREALLPRLRERFATRTTAEWLERLRGRVPCAPVNDVRQALADPQVLAADMLLDVEHPDFGTLREVRSPVRTAGEIRGPQRAPRLGEHTDQILREILSYGDATIARLRDGGIIR